MKTLIYNAEIIAENGITFNPGWILIEDERISALGEGEAVPVAECKIDAQGDLIIPGMIDTHVHFREPGLTHKADISSESAAAVAGGVTSYFDMPNCVPPTVTLAAWADKMERAKATSHANYAFYIGATNSNLETDILKADFSQIPGVKLFLGSSTGNLLVDSQESLEKLFKEVKAVISVHAEDNRRISDNTAKVKAQFDGAEIPIKMHPIIRDTQACLDSTAFAVKLAEKTGARLHVLHVSTAEEVELLKGLNSKNITSETCVQYLTFTDADYDRLGSRIKCNPAIKSANDRSALIQAIKTGNISIVGSDHAPHLLQEKVGDALTAPSGMPNMQFQLPILLDMFSATEVVKITAQNPADIFKIEGRGRIKVGAYADMVRVARIEHTISDADSLSRCGWTPASGMKLRHKVVTTWVNGNIAYNEGKVTDSRFAKSLKFNI